MWEVMKGIIRNVSIKYSAQRKRHTIGRESLFLNEIENQENEIHSITDNLQDAVNERNDLKEELENIQDGEINGYIIRAKANHIESYEKTRSIWQT